MKPRALMITPTLGYKSACGVGLYGLIWGTALVDMEDCEFHVVYTDEKLEAIAKIREVNPDVVFHMFNPAASPWLSDPEIRAAASPRCKHVNIHHDLSQHIVDSFAIQYYNFGYEYAITANPTIVPPTKNIFSTNKLLPASPTIPPPNNEIPVIGYQGFGLPYKGIARLAEIVNAEFDECIFRLHMAQSWFCDRDGSEIAKRKEEIQSRITKPGIKIEYSHHMMETQELVNWLSQNTINCYLYDNSPNCGLASSPDYALAAKRPIAVSQSDYFKNFYSCSPSVVINNPFSLREIIQNGIEPLVPLHQAYSKENFLKDWSNAITHFISL